MCVITACWRQQAYSKYIQTSIRYHPKHLRMMGNISVWELNLIFNIQVSLKHISLNVDDLLNDYNVDANSDLCQHHAGQNCISSLEIPDHSITL